MAWYLLTIYDMPNTPFLFFRNTAIFLSVIAASCSAKDASNESDSASVASSARIGAWGYSQILPDKSIDDRGYCDSVTAVTNSEALNVNSMHFERAIFYDYPDNSSVQSEPSLTLDFVVEMGNPTAGSALSPQSLSVTLTPIVDPGDSGCAARKEQVQLTAYRSEGQSSDVHTYRTSVNGHFPEVDRAFLRARLFHVDILLNNHTIWRQELRAPDVFETRGFSAEGGKEFYVEWDMQDDVPNGWRRIDDRLLNQVYLHHENPVQGVGSPVRVSLRTFPSTVGGASIVQRFESNIENGEDKTTTKASGATGVHVSGLNVSVANTFGMTRSQITLSKDLMKYGPCCNVNLVQRNFCNIREEEHSVCPAADASESDRSVAFCTGEKDWETGAAMYEKVCSAPFETSVP